MYKLNNTKMSMFYQVYLRVHYTFISIYTAKKISAQVLHSELLVLCTKRGDKSHVLLHVSDLYMVYTTISSYTKSYNCIKAGFCRSCFSCGVKDNALQLFFLDYGYHELSVGLIP